MPKILYQGWEKSEITCEWQAVTVAAGPCDMADLKIWTLIKT